MSKNLGTVKFLKGKKHRWRKWAVILAAIVIAAGIAWGLLAAALRPWSLVISQQAVPENLYMQIMNDTVAEVSKYFRQKGAGSVNSDFWETSYQGEVPYRILTDKTLERLKLIAATYATAEEHGYLPAGSLANIEERLQQENERRQTAIANGEPVYGLSAYTLDTFLEYEVDSLQKLYCEDLENEGMALSDEECQAYYDEYKDALFTKNDDISLSYIKISNTMGEFSEQEYTDLKQRMEAVHEKCENGVSLKDAVADDEQLLPYWQEVALKSAEVAAYSRSIPDILDYSAELQPGEVTDVIDEGAFLYLVECTARTEYDYYSLEEVRSNVEKTLRERHYDALMEEKAAQMAIETEIEALYQYTKEKVS